MIIPVSQIPLGTRVVRSKGNYVVGRTGSVISVNEERDRLLVNWDGEKKSWVSVTVVELESTPYEIVQRDGKWPLYRKLK